MNEKNPELEAARLLIEKTGMNLFLTGKAGTGKTTFLKKLIGSSNKRMVVVAPTGIAAINAGGVTIHSFFQLDFNSIPDNVRNHKFDRFSRAKLNIIKSLDVLVIDEISMVRADLLDRIDDVLRRHRNPRSPFGGVQLLMIGDLHQLPPVVTDGEAQIISERYPTPYFFESLALKRAGFRTIELKRIYRQSDERFISLLNAIRTNRAGDRELEALNTCVGKQFRTREKFVRLVTHNWQARDINSSELARLSGDIFSFDAKVEGKFPVNSFPGEESLVLKKGAQVMFIKNDLQKHEWYNGLLAEVTDISENIIRVRTVDGRDVTVREEEWVNNSYRLDEEKGEITEIREGAFRQYPLRLAWAITIHKSQGLTFDRAVIDATDAFAHGQTYVALSRCRTLEGLSLGRPLTPASIITDPAVENFMAAQTSTPVVPDELHNLSVSYTVNLLKDLFDFTEIALMLNDLGHVVSRLPVQYSDLARDIVAAYSRFNKEFTEVSRKFETWFPHYAAHTPGLGVEERIASGAEYFATRLGWVREMLETVPEKVRNKEVQKRLDKVVDGLRNLIFVKYGLLNYFGADPFDTDRYIRLKSSLQVRAEKGEPKPKKVKTAEKKISTETKNPELELTLKSWRLVKAREDGVAAFRIMSNNALRSVANGIPETIEELRSLPNIGNHIASKYGDILINYVKEWKKKKLQSSL